MTLLLLLSLAEAKNCPNSQPCGNSCISWSKTCHVTAPPVKTARKQEASHQARTAPSSGAVENSTGTVKTTQAAATAPDQATHKRQQVEAATLVTEGAESPAQPASAPVTPRTVAQVAPPERASDESIGLLLVLGLAGAGARKTSRCAVHHFINTSHHRRA